MVSNPNNKGDFHRVYLMAKTFGQRPYSLICPDLSDPHAQLVVDTLIFNLGYAEDMEEEQMKLQIMVGIPLKKQMGM